MGAQSQPARLRRGVGGGQRGHGRRGRAHVDVGLVDAHAGDRHAGLADHAFSIEPLIELADRQERDLGLGEMPWPPDYPKMPGEPMRVQPSRARKPAAEATPDPAGEAAPEPAADPR